MPRPGEWDHARLDPLARRIRLLVLDVDGTLTDGSVFVDDHGAETKRFNVRDGFGLRCWRHYGGHVAAITGRRAPGVAFRCRDVGIDPVIQGIREKGPAFESLLERFQVAAEEVGVVGDDLPDGPLFDRAGLAVGVGDCAAEVVPLVDAVTKAPGGRGAVREAVERIMTAQGTWDQVLSHYAGRRRGEG